MSQSTAVTQSQVEAMISLLSDESENVVRRCQEALIENAQLAEPIVRERLAEADPPLERPLSAVLTEMVAARTVDELIDHLRTAPDLERGSVLIGRLIDPTDGPDGLTAGLDALSEALAAQLDDEDEPRAALTRLLVRQHGLVGVGADRTDRLDAVPHGALERRRGLPLPLCMIWILVARRCGLPLVGLNMPAHFLVRWGEDDDALVLDPFDGGAIVPPADCARVLRSHGAPQDVTMPPVASDRDMLLRTVANLMMIAQRDGDAALQGRCRRVLREVSETGGA